MASEQQHQAIERAIRACQQRRAEQRRQEEKQRKQEEKRRAEKRRQQERLAECQQYEQRFRADQLTQADDERAGSLAPIVRRLARGQLKHEDVEAEFAKLPCAGTSAENAIGTTYAQLVAATTPGWLLTRTPSKSVRQLVVQYRESIDAESLKHLSGHIDVSARQAVRSGQQEDIERFATLCRWKQQLGLKQLGNCIAVLDLAAANK